MQSNQYCPNIAACLLGPNLKRQPDNTAYLCDDEVVSYRLLGDGACYFASLLRAKGIQRGDRVLIVLLDSPVFVAAFLGITLIGAVAVAVNTALPGEQYDFISRDCGARLILASPAVTLGDAGATIPCIRCGERLADVLCAVAVAPVAAEPMQADELAYMLYTSGSTGVPKGVPHRHADLLESAERYAVQVLGMGGADTVLSASKLYFSYGLGTSLAFPLYCGARAVLQTGKPAPEQLLALVARHSVSIFFSVPTMYSQIIRATSQEHLQLPLRHCLSAGEALPAAVFHEWQRLTGLELLEFFGSTELSNSFIFSPPGSAIAGCTGQRMPGYEIRLVDDTGAEVPTGVPGHLLVRGPGAAASYWNLPEKTAATMLADGFLRTGDIFLEQDGYYVHQGRSDDMLRSGGQWVSPVQVEEALRAHPAVIDCAAAACRIGGLDRPAVHVVLQPGTAPGALLEKALKAFLATRLPDYMCPVLYRFIDELPRTATGKVQRFKLKQ